MNVYFLSVIHVTCVTVNKPSLDEGVTSQHLNTHNINTTVKPKGAFSVTVMQLYCS